jgi:hypothetical protein
VSKFSDIGLSLHEVAREKQTASTSGGWFYSNSTLAAVIGFITKLKN